MERIPSPAYWPSTVVQLAEALDHGQDCAFALHDALLEAGASEFAEYFRGPEYPTKWWALSIILGKNRLIRKEEAGPLGSADARRALPGAASNIAS